MFFELKLAWRYFRARRKSLARFTSFVAVAGIAAGVASLILAQSLSRGFADEMRDKILANTPHISVFVARGGEIVNWREISGELEKLENVEKTSPTVFESAVLIGKNADSGYAILRVLESSKIEVQSSKIEGQIIEVSLGKELAAKTNLNIGDEAEILTIDDEQTKTSKVKIRDIFQTGLYEYDSTRIDLSPENYVKIAGKPDFAPGVLSVSVKDIYAADKTAARIRDKLGADFRVLSWQEANEPLFAALSLERRVALAIISLIIFIAALNITTTLALLVGERRFDIAILRTCGARARNLVFVFLFEGLFLGFLGVFSGLIIGLAGAFLGNYFRIVSLPNEVYSLAFIPLRPDFSNVLSIVSAAFALCFAATVYPAYKASRIKPLENLRRR